MFNSSDREVEIIHELRVKLLTYSAELARISQLLGELDWYLPSSFLNQSAFACLCSREISIFKTCD
jgi:hypothetical protein